MIREVDLVSYLPPFMADFKEINVALEAENPEFRLVWQGVDRALKNEFILDADEYGISRFEKMLKIYPSKEDTLESRRARVLARWFSSIPYVWRVFLERLKTICGNSTCTVIPHFVDGYLVELELNLELYGQVEELEHLIEEMFPANIAFSVKNSLICNADGFALVIGGVCFCERFFITNDGKETHVINGSANTGGGIGAVESFFITNDSRENMSASGAALYGGAAANVEMIGISNDFKEQFNISGDALTGAGTVVTEFFEIQQNEE